MGEPGQIAAFAFAASFLVFVLELVRRRALTVRYSLVWLVIASGMLAVSSFGYPLVLRIAPLLGFKYPPSALFFLAFGGLVLATLHNSTVLTRLHAENTTLGQRVAILEADIASRVGLPPADPLQPPTEPPK